MRQAYQRHGSSQLHSLATRSWEKPCVCALASRASRSKEEASSSTPEPVLGPEPGSEEEPGPAAANALFCCADPGPTAGSALRSTQRDATRKTTVCLAIKGELMHAFTYQPMLRYVHACRAASVCGSCRGREDLCSPNAAPGKRRTAGSRLVTCGVEAVCTGGVPGVAARELGPIPAATASTAPAMAPPSPCTGTTHTHPVRSCAYSAPHLCIMHTARC